MENSPSKPLRYCQRCDAADHTNKKINYRGNRGRLFFPDQLVTGRAAAPGRWYGMADEPPWLIRDYTAFWRLPSPLPPARWPLVLMGLLLGVLVVAIGLGLGVLP
jgi:hypothetical protein